MEQPGVPSRDLVAVVNVSALVPAILDKFEGVSLPFVSNVAAISGEERLLLAPDCDHSGVAKVVSVWVGHVRSAGILSGNEAVASSAEA